MDCVDDPAMTATKLLAMANGLRCGRGYRCLFCGGECDGSHYAAEVMRDTFTAHATLRGRGRLTTARRNLNAIYGRYIAAQK